MSANACVPGIVEKQCHRLRERRVIFLEGQDVIRPLLRNGLGDLFLTPHRINRDHRPFEVQQAEEFGNGGDFVGLAPPLSRCPNTKRLALAQALTIWMAAVAVA